MYKKLLEVKPTVKICSRCKQEKAASDFFITKSSCKVCATPL